MCAQSARFGLLAEKQTASTKPGTCGGYKTPDGRRVWSGACPRKLALYESRVKKIINYRGTCERRETRCFRRDRICIRFAEGQSAKTFLIFSIRLFHLLFDYLVFFRLDSQRIFDCVVKIKK